MKSKHIFTQQIQRNGPNLLRAMLKIIMVITKVAKYGSPGEIWFFAIHSFKVFLNLKVGQKLYKAFVYFFIIPTINKDYYYYTTFLQCCRNWLKRS